MTSRTQDIDLDAWLANTLGGAGNGNGNKMMLGMGTSSWAWQNRLALRVPRGNLFDGIPSAAAISAFNIKMRTNSGNSGIGSAVRFFLERATGTFSEYPIVAGAGGVPAGSNINAFVSSSGPASGEWPGPARVTTNRASFSGAPAADQWITVNALALGREWFAHPEWTSLVLVGVAALADLSGYDESTTSRRCTFYTRESTSKPYAEITFGGNSPPNKPTNPILTLGADGTSFTITTTYTDPDGDTSPRYEVQFDPTA